MHEVGATGVYVVGALENMAQLCDSFPTTICTTIVLGESDHTKANIVFTQI